MRAIVQAPKQDGRGIVGQTAPARLLERAAGTVMRPPRAARPLAPGRSERAFPSFSKMPPCARGRKRVTCSGCLLRGRGGGRRRGPAAPRRRKAPGKKVRESRKKFLTAGQRTRNISPCASGGTESDGAPGGAPQNLENRILNSEEEKSQANDSCERKPGPSAHPQDGGRARAETKIGLQREAIPAS